MKIQILGIGKVRERYYREAIDDYLGRLEKYIAVDSLETTREMSGSEADREAAYRKVRDRHLAATVRVALDERGRQMSSAQLADWLRGKRDEGTASISFVLGGAHGMPWIGPLAVAAILAYHVGKARRPGQEITLLILAVILGTTWDSLLVTTVLLQYDSVMLVCIMARYWIIAMWALFPMTLNV